MCAGYGLEPLGPNSYRGERGGAGGHLAPGDTAEGEAFLARWIAERQGKAGITGKKALNLNPIIREVAGERRFDLAWWWLHVGGAPAKYTAFNARADRLLASWHQPFQQRALLPATWYVEKGVRFKLPEGDAFGGSEFGIAAVTAPGLMPDGSDVTSYSLVTRDAVGQAAATHDRMPLVLPREFHEEWLTTGRVGDQSLVRRAITLSEEISHAIVASPDLRPAPATPVDQPTLF